QTQVQAQTASSAGVTLELGTTPETSGTYTKPTSKGLSADEIAQLQADAEKNVETLKKMVEELILKQSKASTGIDISGLYSSTASTQAGLNINGEALSTDEAETAASAADAISEDGEYGVEAVSNRIVDFAKSISGGDRSKYELLKSAIDEGFKQAGKALGTDLPEISNKTYEAVMTKLDKWYKEEN
ncbi:MAG: hypothetical protein HGA22_03045, partial [Clostridiales bacterium]|nr:hypothetical protein [Clostridiales bacterium]